MVYNNRENILVGSAAALAALAVCVQRCDTDVSI